MKMDDKNREGKSYFGYSPILFQQAFGLYGRKNEKNKHFFNHRPNSEHDRA